MYQWDETEEKCSIKCDLGCESQISLYKSDFTATQWKTLEPEVGLQNAALNAKWEMAYDNEKDEVMIICPNCIARRKAGL